MQGAKLPRQTTEASIQMIMTEPGMECEPETSQATVAMIQPPMTPLQKMVEAGLWMASRPSWAREWTTAGLMAPVRDARAAKASAPRILAGGAGGQRGRVFQKWVLSARTRATG